MKLSFLTILTLYTWQQLTLEVEGEYQAKKSDYSRKGGGGVAVQPNSDKKLLGVGSAYLINQKWHHLWTAPYAN